MNSIHPIAQIHFIIFITICNWKIFNYNAQCSNYDDENEDYVDDGEMR